MRYRKRPVVIEATRWFKNGEHPDDNSRLLPDGEYSEGQVVRYYRRPDSHLRGEFNCRQCGHVYGIHGWIDMLEGGHIVCPGDWIITGVEGEHYPCKPDIFDATYEVFIEPHYTSRADTK